MRWGSALSRAAGAAAALEEAGAEAARQLDGERADLVVVFASSHHAGACDLLAGLAARRFPTALLVGCTAGGVIGGAREAEDGPALSVTAAALPRVALAPFHVDALSLPDPAAGGEAWRARIGAPVRADPKLLLLLDPFTIDAHALLAGLDAAFPRAPKFGGLASGGRRPGENRLLLGAAVHRSGAIGVAFTGDLAVDTVIAQGCRPVGKPMLVTRCHENVAQELDGRRPIEVLTELYQSLEPADRELMQHSLFLGLDMREERIEFDPSELLVRNLIGVDESSGALAVGARLHPMGVVQFVLRDAGAADADLRRMLDRQAGTPAPSGALLFSCLGRGAGLFGRPDHDTDLFQEKLGPAPLGGFFCNGEIGPVGATTFLHGYTSAFAIFREGGAPPAPRRGRGS
ncbi:MAG TPA: FIST N-terminal domain-containing protein [Anaeromyxobacteraceae bacterium]|nr:FIST N-terminal domain-containing protein [Anaeromyxobacteraceae bacterium]